MIVTEPDNKKDVVILNEEGKRLRSSRELGHGINIKNPTCVAIDSSDNIFLTDFGGSKIFKLSIMLQLLDMTTVQDSQLWGVAVVGDEVMVCDSKNNCVLVYTKELKYVRSISWLSSDQNNDISPDDQGNLYVCDYMNSSIHVLSNSGEFLRTMECVVSGAKRLGNLRGLCISSQYLFAANWNSHTVSVYTTEGEHVTSFGRCGKDVGDIYHPCGVSVDEDGFVYVCDIGNNRIQVF